jgi:glucokinase
LTPAATEAGHADWAARSEPEIVVLRHLIERFGRAEVEHVLSGPGLALERRCAGCVETLGLFVGAYGAEAGNLALRAVATAGLFVGGGIAPKILPALTDGHFLQAFLNKGTFRELLARIPVKIILNPDAGLLGAAVAAEQTGI